MTKAELLQRVNLLPDDAVIDTSGWDLDDDYCVDDSDLPELPPLHYVRTRDEQRTYDMCAAYSRMALEQLKKNLVFVRTLSST